jgi:hypothetical protein
MHRLALSVVLLTAACAPKYKPAPPPAPEPAPEPVPPAADCEPPVDPVVETLQGQSGQAQQCFQQALKLQPGLSGKVLVTLAIDADGKVTDAKAEGDFPPPMLACVAEVARKTVFTWSCPKPLNLQFPYVFAASP